MQETIESIFTRPQRQTYYMYDLGPHFFFVNERKAIRTDFTITNAKNIKIHASFYEFESDLL